MAFGQYPFWVAHPPKRRTPDRREAPDPGAEQRTTAAEGRRPAQPRQLNAGVLTAEIDAFRLHLAAEGRAAGTVRNYTNAVRWFAGGWLPPKTGKTSWAQVETEDVERWMEWLLGQYSRSYARSQFVSLRQFFTWLSHQRQLTRVSFQLVGWRIQAVTGHHVVEPRRVSVGQVVFLRQLGERIGFVQVGAGFCWHVGLARG